ncbi:MAG: flavin monoamine oxidase family protein, partial [Hyphomicrobiaceae bacterium]
SGTIGEYLGDYGPTWIWPEFQPTVARWLTKLKLETFAQFDDGQTVVELSSSQSAVVADWPGQTGSLRILGGTHILVERIAAMLPARVVRTNAHVRQIAIEDDGITVTIGHTEKAVLRACQVVVALPPRIAATTIDWLPALPTTLNRALNDLPTWMAPHAKALVIYDRPFWRSRGLSGRITSRVGPLMEVHDHSSRDGRKAALFGFVGWPHNVRIKLGAQLEHHIVEQLRRCFGAPAPSPKEFHLTDWALDPLVATPSDLINCGDHPQVGPEIVRQAHRGQVWFAAAETASENPGLIAGALSAAERVAMAIGEAQQSTSA